MRIEAYVQYAVALGEEGRKEGNEPHRGNNGPADPYGYDGPYGYRLHGPATSATGQEDFLRDRALESSESNV